MRNIRLFNLNKSMRKSLVETDYNVALWLPKAYGKQDKLAVACR